MGTEDARLPREDFGTSFWQLATVGYAGSGCLESAVMSLIGPMLMTCAVHQSRLLSKVLQTCRSNGRHSRCCEGFQTPAVTNIPPPTRPASGNLQGTKAREGARIRPCHTLSYGDLTAGGPQLRSAARVSRAVRMTMQLGGDASSDPGGGVSVQTGAAVAW